VRGVLSLVLFLAAPFNSAAARSEPADADTAIRKLLDDQVAAWNRGDVVAFMEGYWKSPQTTFSGGSGVLRGWQAVLERYRCQYPDRAAMGRLLFSDLEISLLAPNAALVLGHWQLERAQDRPGGVFTLVLRKLPEGWRIVHDHTSVVVRSPGSEVQ
jgi:ketosteroid isomerase-like protein